MRKKNKKYTTILISVFLVVFCAQAQAISYSFEEQNTPTSPQILSQDNAFRKAWLYSTILPGLGQAYNKKYWKIPIIYGFFTGLGWGIYYFHQEYFAFRRALFQEKDIGKNDMQLSENQLRHQAEVYRKDRDWLILFLGLAYIFNILDAHIDAHLNTFNLSNDLALQLKPSLTLGKNAKPIVGFSLTLNHKR